MMKWVWKGCVHLTIRPLLSRGFRLATVQMPATSKGRITLTQAFKTDLQQAIAHLSVHYHLPLFPKVDIPGPMEAGALPTLMDASSTVGFGVFLAAQPGFYVWGKWSELEKQKLIINELEAVVSIFMLDSLGRLTPSGQITEVIHECIDNTTAENLHRKGSISSSRFKAEAISHKRNQLLQGLDITTRQLRVPTTHNLLSDTLSRGEEGRFLAQAKSLGFTPIELEVQLDPATRDISWLTCNTVL